MKNKGFTLIELLLVVAIIIIIASLVIVSVSKARTQGRDSKRIADLGRIQLALESYKDGAGTYPTALSTSWQDVSTTTIATALQSYISPMPKDPITGSNYGYKVLGSSPAGGYWLAALMEDSTNIPGGSDYTLGSKCYQIWGGTATVKTGNTAGTNC